MRKKAGMDDTIPAVMPNKTSSKESRQNWARLIRKIYEVDPLVCPKCQGQDIDRQKPFRHPFPHAHKNHHGQKPQGAALKGKKIRQS